MPGETRSLYNVVVERSGKGAGGKNAKMALNIENGNRNDNPKSTQNDRNPDHPKPPKTTQNAPTTIRFYVLSSGRLSIR